MLVSWKYRPRKTIIQRLDPRARLIFLACIILGITVPNIWDFRLVFPLFLLTLGLYLLARIEWQDVRRTWLFIFVLVFFIVGLNGVLSGRGGPTSVIQDTSAPLFSIPLFLPGTTWGFTLNITLVRLFFAMTQMTRMLTMAILAIPIPYTMDPNIYGVTFRRMGVSDKVSFTMDLAFRFLPTLARDMSITIDSQRARGYEMDNLKGGIVARLRRLAPLIVPVTMQSTVTGEEVIDAMDLRAFGTAPRTWLKDLKYAPRDYVFIGLGIAIALTLMILQFGFGIGDFWVPEFLIRWAAGG
jgi:energy-coupling factor transport system permease protein